jgi:rhodanese-related sulfurtransferase
MPSPHVRPEDEFTVGHLPGALNIPLAELERRLGELPADREVIAYCRGPYCVLSFEAVAALRARGYMVRRPRTGIPSGKPPDCRSRLSLDQVGAGNPMVQKADHKSLAWPIVNGKEHASPSVFQPEAPLREARRQKGVPLLDVPQICML